MQVLTHGTGNSAPEHAVLIFGLGMIGNAVRDSLLRLGYRVIREIDFNWHDERKRTLAYSEIATACTPGAAALGHVSFVWTAGQATFHATESETSRELQTFSEIVAFARRLQESKHHAEVAFHLLSSAGGLFEGQQVIDLNSTPAPRRPYGQMKLAQERLVKHAFESRQIRIYRPSSVYGPMKLVSGKGLINHLVQNGRNGAVTVLDSHVMALRDYVFSQDVGDFVARTVHTHHRSTNPKVELFLVSSRCSSIFEVVRKIQLHLKLRLQIRFDENFGNSRNITFTEQVQPQGWHPVSLDVGIRQFLVGKQPMRTRSPDCQPSIAG